MEPIGYRPPHTGHSKVAKLRADYAQYEQQTFESQMERDLARERKALIPIPLNYAIPAIRMWEVSNDRLLKSLAFGYTYSDPVLREELPPEYRGLTGFWAVKPSGSFILKEYENPRVMQVFGYVELSGKVIEHEYGWRAEVCTIQELYIVAPYSAPSYIKHFEQMYQCDVYQVASFETFLRVAFE